MPCVEWPQLLEDMTEALRHAAKDSGMPPEKAETFALEACKTLLERVFNNGAAQFYVPSKNTVERRQRNNEIRRRAKLMSIKQLCEAYPGLSESHIRNILKPPYKRRKRRKNKKGRRNAAREEAAKYQGVLF